MFYKAIKGIKMKVLVNGLVFTLLLISSLTKAHVGSHEARQQKPQRIVALAPHIVELSSVRYSTCWQLPRHAN